MKLIRRIPISGITGLLIVWLLRGLRIATVPSRMARELVRLHPLRLLKPPLAIPGVVLCQGWHEIHRNDPGHRWLRQAVTAEAAVGAV